MVLYTYAGSPALIFYRGNDLDHDHEGIFRMIENLERLALAWFATSSVREKTLITREFAGSLSDLLRLIPANRPETHAYIKAISAQCMHQDPELTCYMLYAQCDLAITGTLDLTPLTNHYARRRAEYRPVRHDKHRATVLRLVTKDS